MNRGDGSGNGRGREDAPTDEPNYEPVGISDSSDERPEEAISVLARAAGEYLESY